MGSKKEIRQLSPKRNFLLSASPSIWSFKSLTKVGMRVGKMLGDFLLRPREEVEMDHKIEEVRHRRPEGDTEECGQGLHAFSGTNWAFPACWFQKAICELG